MWLPPRWVRRVVLAPIVVVLALAVLATLPVWLLLALLASWIAAARGRAGPGAPANPLRPLRLLWIVVVYLTVDAVALLALFALWLASGFGWKESSPPFQRAYYAMTGWFLRVLFGQSRWALRLSVEVQGPDPDVAAPGRPELVVCRHAGPGDSFILIHALVNWYAREPRIVLKDTLQWDPAIDVLLNRLPSRFIAASGRRRRALPPPDGDGGRTAEDEISELATGLDENDAFVLFPEGGNFTPFRRVRAIQRLHALGLHSMARRAEAMEHVLAPRPGGLLAALDAAPDAGVIFVAHTGLERMLSVADVWRELPMDKKIIMRWWVVPPDEVPAGRQERIDWLYDWWARIDRWIGANVVEVSSRHG
jgi:1-acyl-sn-glycerol-3-phosphate acyltransferase